MIRQQDRARNKKYEQDGTDIPVEISETVEFSEFSHLRFLSIADSQITQSQIWYVSTQVLWYTILKTYLPGSQRNNGDYSYTNNRKSCDKSNIITLERRK